MTTPRERIEGDLKQAIKAGEKEKVGTLRLLLTEITNERIRTGQEVDDATFAALTRKAIKQRHEAAEQYRRGGRTDLAEKEEREAEHLATYLPQQASETEIREAIEGFVAAEGLQGPSAMGKVMKEMLARFGPRADGATISRIARQVLAS